MVKRRYPWEENSRNEEICPKCCLQQQQVVLETRRDELLQKIPYSDDQKQTAELDNTLVEEWVLLTSQREKISKEIVIQENKATLMNNLENLHGLLHVIGCLDHTRTPASLKTCLVALFKELGQYLKKDRDCSSNVEVYRCCKKVCKGSNVGPHVMLSRQGVRVKEKAPINSVKTPLASVRADMQCNHVAEDLCTPQSSKRVKFDKEKSSIVGKSSNKRMRTMHTPPPVIKTPVSASRVLRSQTRASPATPQSVRHDSEDLRKNLLKSRERLRETPGVKRSPGGTPVQRRRELDAEDPGDLLALALHKKFRNVRRLYGSPGGVAEGANDSQDEFNISID